MWFYGCLKGLSEAEVQSEMDTLLDDVGLLHKRHEQTKNLSGNFACLVFLLKKVVVPVLAVPVLNLQNRFV